MEILFIVSIALVGIGVFLVFQHKKAARQLKNIQSVERSSVGEVIENHDHFLINFGSGTYQHYVELYANVKCDQPLKAPVSDTPCVYYDYRVSRHYETIVREKDSQGKMVDKRVTSTETLSSDKREVPFHLTEKESMVEVEPQGSDKFPLRSHFSNPQQISSDIREKLNVTGTGGAGRTLGFEIVENIIPLEQSLYVLGEANDRNGKLQVSRPREKEQSFILSTQSEDILVDKLKKTTLWLKIGMIASLVLGTAGIIAGILIVLGIISI